MGQLEDALLWVYPKNKTLMLVLRVFGVLVNLIGKESDLSCPICANQHKLVFVENVSHLRHQPLITTDCPLCKRGGWYKEWYYGEEIKYSEWRWTSYRIPGLNWLIRFVGKHRKQGLVEFHTHTDHRAISPRTILFTPHNLAKKFHEENWKDAWTP